MEVYFPRSLNNNELADEAVKKATQTCTLQTVLCIELYNVSPTQKINGNMHKTTSTFKRSQEKSKPTKPPK